ncbi:MAG: hypothetical protein HOK94_05720, partial [Candidatus Marinimicrobia bacterium]|nr:hypothetical protein [Candidatus Neomarinimicrobiota bacterium]MBT5461124.1 hypothetical protein [Candidatus Neomarinimicrobiota bacterium]
CGFFKPAKNDGNTEYCSRCGEQMISECFYCEKPLTDPHASFCERCGEKIKENEK